MLRDYLPEYYKKSQVTRIVFDAPETECLRLKQEIQAVGDAFFVMLADKYIARNQHDVGLDQRPISGLERCRNMILLRLRSANVTTVEALKKAVSFFVDGSVVVIEHTADYSFTVKLILNKDERYTSDHIAFVIEELKPAHLAHIINPQFPPMTFFTKNAARLRAVDFYMFFYAYGRPIIKLDGRKRLDGTWQLDASYPGLPFINLDVKIDTQNKPPGMTFGFVAMSAFALTNIFGVSLMAQYIINVINQYALFQTAARFTGLKAAQAYHLTAAVKMDGRWTLDGSVRLDGSRRLDYLYIEEAL